MELRNKNVAVVGLGKSGLATARLLHSLGAEVLVLEKKPRAEVEPAASELEQLGVVVKAGGYGLADFRKTELVVLSPGVDEKDKIYVELGKKGVEVLGELELASRFITAPIIAVSGTDGKTTTVSLLGEIFSRELPGRVWVGGNIGAPAAELLISGQKPELVVLEVSSFQLAQARTFHPKVSVLLNIAPDHLDRHADLKDYCRAKQRLFMNQGPGDAAVLNSDDPRVKKMAETIKAELVWFGAGLKKKCGATIAGQELFYRNGRRQFKVPLEGWKLRGRHNLQNLLAAAAAAGWMGASREAILDAVKNFAPPAHRLEFVAEVSGVSYFDDSKATTPHAVAAALESFSEKVILLLGGRNKQIDFRPLAKVIQAKAKTVLCFGEARYEIAEQLASQKLKPRLAERMQDAVLLARRIALPGEVVLLSPGCASFDEFRDYKERGERFKELVRSFA